MKHVALAGYQLAALQFNGEPIAINKSEKIASSRKRDCCRRWNDNTDDNWTTRDEYYIAIDKTEQHSMSGGRKYAPTLYSVGTCLSSERSEMKACVLRDKS